MEASKCNASFSIKYKTEFGQNVYIMGSIPEFGSWREFKAKLKWTENHIWCGTFSLPRSPFEYKYAVYNSKSKEAIWETGRNRQADFRNKNEIVLDEIWERFKIHFLIYYPLPENTIMRINGDTDEMGHWNLYGPKNMNLTKEDVLLPNGGYGKAWEFEVTAPITMTSLGYKYTIYNSKTDIAIWEREPTRILKLPENSNYEEILKIKQEIGLADFTQMDIPVNGCIEKWDVNFVSEINFDKIGDYPIYIGAYPQHEEDVKTLAKNGITGVLNVQTEIDMKHRHTDLERMRSIYSKYGIKLISFPIHDFNPEDLAKKTKDAGNCLNELLKEKRTVYVHCTAGMGRAPSTVISYLVIHEGMKLANAYDFVKEYRNVANPNMWVLKKALEESTS